LASTPTNFGGERPFVFHAASAETLTPLVL
jgi:hypothetical protein